MKALGRFRGFNSQLLESNSSVHEIAQNEAGGVRLAVEKKSGCLVKQRPGKGWVALYAFYNSLFEISRQRHSKLPLAPRFERGLAPLVLGPHCLRAFDIGLLTLLGAATQQDNQSVTVFCEIDPIAGAPSRSDIRLLRQSI